MTKLADQEARVTVLCSGNGSNLQAIIDGCESGGLPGVFIVKVITNRKAAFAAQRAERAGIPTEYFNLVNDGFHVAGEKDAAKLREARAEYDDALGQKVLLDKPDLVVLAGWMHVFSPSFLKHLDAAKVPIINLHPALPGECSLSPGRPWAGNVAIFLLRGVVGRYNGANAIKRAYDDFQAGKLEQGRTGVMIHYCIAEVDMGSPILIEEIECREGESLEQLEDRIHAVEHVLIVKATGLVAKKILDRKKQT